MSMESRSGSQNGGQYDYPPDVKQNDPHWYQPPVQPSQGQRNHYAPQRLPLLPSPAPTPHAERSTEIYPWNRYGDTPSPAPTTYLRRSDSQQHPFQPNQPPYPQTPQPFEWSNTAHDYVESPVSPSGESVSTDFYPQSEYDEIVQPQPQRPGMPAHQFSVPYIATPHDPHLATAQFEHPYQATPTPPNPNLLGKPPLPPRANSAPSGPREDWRTQTPGQPVVHSYASSITSQHESLSNFSPSDHVDEVRSNRMSRFVGNMLPVRVGRATIQSLQSTAKLPYYLSPWGDNNPVTLPNVRRRDFILAGVLHVGIETLAPSAVTMIEKTFQKAVETTIEEVADLGINIFQGANGHKIKRRIGLNSIELRIQHKLLGEEARLVFQGTKEAADKKSCAKGWFCPYLYCSGRSTDLARSKDFSIAELRGPGLAADASIAPTLLSSFAETYTPIISICPWDPTFPTFPRYRRVAIFLAGISPYRTATAWSQARIPNEARMSFHIFTHIPALVVPAAAEAPILSWSSWTVAQMLAGRKGGTGHTKYKLSKKLKHDEHLAYGDASFLEREGKESRYDEQHHFQELMNFLETVVDPRLMEEDMRPRWKGVAGKAVQAMLDAVLSVPDAIRATAVGHCELERAGFVMFRY